MSEEGGSEDGSSEKAAPGPLSAFGNYVGSWLGMASVPEGEQLAAAPIATAVQYSLTVRYTRDTRPARAPEENCARPTYSMSFNSLTVFIHLRWQSVNSLGYWRAQGIL